MLLITAAPLHIFSVLYQTISDYLQSVLTRRKITYYNFYSGVGFCFQMNTRLYLKPSALVGSSSLLTEKPMSVLEKYVSIIRYLRSITTTATNLYCNWSFFKNIPKMIDTYYYISYIIATL